ncbi:MAG TPA: hypothetical protein P5155_02795 [Candidatus Absconditabacterales bacterium]|nr:hypothetical protein [Candidatus Absconditabacterales bacterium]
MEFLKTFERKKSILVYHGDINDDYIPEGIVAPFTMKGTLTVVGDHKCVFKLENGKKFLFDTEKIDLESITVIE